MSNQVVHVREIIDADASIVDAAGKVAESVLQAMGGGLSVVVSLQGVRGVTSSFFNVLLKRVFDVHGPDGVHTRLQFQFDNGAQETVWRRSVSAVVGTGAAPRSP